MLDFEKPLFEIKNKIESLKESQEKNEVDLQEEIDMLEASLERETKKIYTNLKPWDRVQIARLQERPITIAITGTFNEAILIRFVAIDSLCPLSSAALPG